MTDRTLMKLPAFVPWERSTAVMLTRSKGPYGHAEIYV